MKRNACENEKKPRPLDREQEVILFCEVKNIPEGAEVKIAVWEHDENNEHDHVADLTGTVKDGKLEIPWQVIYTQDNDDSTSAKELAEKAIPSRNITLSRNIKASKANKVQSSK